MGLSPLLEPFGKEFSNQTLQNRRRLALTHLSNNRSTYDHRWWRPRFRGTQPFLGTFRLCQEQGPFTAHAGIGMAISDTSASGRAFHCEIARPSRVEQRLSPDVFPDYAVPVTSDSCAISKKAHELRYRFRGLVGHTVGQVRLFRTPIYSTVVYSTPRPAQEERRDYVTAYQGAPGIAPNARPPTSS